MKHIWLYICAAALPLLFTACSDDDDSDEQATISLSLSGTMTDRDGNQYATIRVGGLEWMAENLRGTEPWYTGTYVNNGFEYDFSVSNEEEEDANIAVAGDYYTYEQALANCPDGWRLPTDDDWKQLELALGMSQSEVDRTGWRQGAGYNMASASGMRMAYNGQLSYYSYSVKVFQRGAYGNYWSSTTDDSTVAETVWIRSITPAMNKVERVACGTELRYMSVRYVREVR